MESVKSFRILLVAGLAAGLFLLTGCGPASSPQNTPTSVVAREAPTAAAVPVAGPTVAPTLLTRGTTPAVTQGPTLAPAPTHGATPPPTPKSKPKPTPTPTPRPTQTATPTPEPELALASGMVGLFLAFYGGSSSNLLRTVLTDSTSGEMTGSKYITIKKDSKAVGLYVPETGEATLIDSYTSPSYAPTPRGPTRLTTASTSAPSTALL